MNLILLILSANLLLTRVKGNYNLCPDASFQSVTEKDPVQCKSICFKRDFTYFQLSGVFCFCSNSNSCSGFDKSESSFPVALSLTASDGFISEPLQVDVVVELADRSYSGDVDLVLDGFQTTVLSSDGVAPYSVLKTYLKPGETKIKASASSDGLTINNSTTVTVRCKMIIDHQMPSELIVESGVVQMLSINLIAGYNVYVKVKTDGQDKYSFLIMDPKVLVAGRLFTSLAETSPNVLYFSDVSISKGYMYGTQLLASSAGSVDLEVRCGDTNSLMNTTSLNLVKGLNSFILTPFYVERTDCFAAVRTDEFAGLYIRNPISYSADAEIADMSLSVFTSQPREILVPVHWDSPGRHQVLFVFTSFNELVEKSTDIVVLDKVQGLHMIVQLNDKTYRLRDGELNVTVSDKVAFSANVEKGTDVEYKWDPDPNTLIFTTPTTQTVRVTADNRLAQPQTVEVRVRVADQEFDVSDLEVVSEIMLLEKEEEEAGMFLLTGEEVHISCNITGGTGMKITLEVWGEGPLTIKEDLYNKNAKYPLSYTHTYTSPHLASTLALCVSNTLSEKCTEFPLKITVIERVVKPNIGLPEFIERGRVITVKSDVTAASYLWTRNVPKVEMTLTQTGLSFPENVDISANTGASHSFYFNKIGSSTIGLYVYNLLSWEYTEKTVYVESLVGDVPLSFVPEKYATTDQPVKLTINCPKTATHHVALSTGEVEETRECLLTPIEYVLTFTSPGEKQVTVSTFNNISSSDQTYTIVVQDLVDLDFTVVSAGISPNTSVAVGSTVSLVATAGEAFSPQPSLVVSWNISGVLVSTHDLVSGAEITVVSSFSHQFSSVGDQNIECCVQNNVSSSCARNTLRVLTPVSGLAITYANSSYVIAPGQAVHLRVSVREGSELLVAAKIGDSLHEVQLSNKQGTLQHVFVRAGVFPVTVTAYNDISSITKSLPSFIYVQNEVQGVSLVDHSPEKQEMDRSTLRTSEVYLTVLIERGTNATVRCNFGVDSTSVVTVEAQHSPFNLVVAEREQEITCKYRYKTTGAFSPSVRVYNSISDVNIPSPSLPVFLVEIPIEGGAINLPDTTRIDRELQLDYSLVAGSNVLHTWYIENVPFEGAAFQPEREGIYTISLTLENSLNSLTVSKEVSVESKLSSVTFLKNLGVYHKLTEPVEFGLVLNPEAEFNVKYQVDMGDGKVFSSPRVSHLYPDIGVYQISLKVSNSISNIGLVKVLNVQDEILRVMIKGSLMVLERQLSSFNAEVFKKSTSKLEENVHYIWKLDGNTQEQDASDFSILLENPGTYTLSLTVYNDVSEQSVSETLVVTSNTSCHPPGVQVTGVDNVRVLSTDTVSFEAVIKTNCESKHTIRWSVLTLERVSVQDYMETRSKTLRFRASFLEAGSYIVRLVVFVTDSPEVYRSDEVMMTVVSVPLIPVLNYPTFTTTNTKETLEISLADSVILNKSLSLEDFNFEWSCTFRSAKLSYNPCTKLQLSNSPNISAHFNVSGFADLSVNITHGENPSSSSSSSSWRYVGSANLVLNVTNYVVPLLKLSVSHLHQLTPDKRTVATLQCSHRGVPCFNPTVEWRVHQLEGSECGSGAQLDHLPLFSLSEEMTTTGLTKRNLVIKAGVFSAGGTYKMEGCVWQGVCAGQLLKFNCGPVQGKCTVGLEQDGLVEVTCRDWVSQSGQLQYHVTYQAAQFPVVVYSGPKSSSRFLLPPGEHTVSVSVSDSSGARTNLPPFLVSVPRLAGYDLNTTELLHGNEYQLVLQIINSDINTLDPENNSVPQQWAAELREVLAGINNTGDISTYLSSLSFTVANFLNTNANQEGLQLFIEFLEMLLTFLKEVLAGRYTLPDNALDVILEILNKLLSLTRKLFSSEDPKLYLPLLSQAYTLCDDVTALVLTIQLNERVSGEEDLVQKQQFVGVLGRKLESDRIQGETFETSGYKFQLPHSVDFQRAECVQGHMVLYDENPYGALDPVSSHVSSLTLRYCNGSEVKVKDTKEDITITLPVNDTKGNTESVFSVLTHKRTDISTTNQYKVQKQANIHRIQIDESGALTVQITEMNAATNVPLSVLVGVDKVPDADDFIKSGLVEKSSSVSFHFTTEQLSQYNASELVLSVTNYENPALPYDKQAPPDVRKYNIQYWYNQCLYRAVDGWREDGCKSSEGSSPTEAVCRCSHLTLFASRHFITPNKIDIGTILTTRRLEDGHVILTLSCTLLFVYLVTLTILVKLDIVRGSNSSVIYLEDNYVRDKQGYLVRIVTGSQPNAGTTAKVNIKLYGKQRDGPARLLSAQRPLFSSKSRESFVLKFPTSLGKLHHIHIWHDNSGKDPSWFLENVTVTDLNTNRTRYFPCHEWLAVEEGNGDIEKMIPCSKSPYKTRWDAFISNASFSEHHLWASIFKDHTYANFSKPQRLTVCFTLIFIAMAINVAFWNPALDTTFNFTIFNIGMEVVSQGVLTGVLLLPFVVGIIILFRRSQTRIPLLVYPDSTKVLSQSSINDADLSRDFKRRAGLTPVLEELSTPRSGPILENPGSTFSCEGGVSLPWWCSIVGWIICFLAISCSVVVSTFYGMQFGNNKSLQWLASFFVSLLESIFISQPLIVLGCGIYASLSYGKKTKGRPLSKADTRTLNFMLPRNFTTKAYEGLARLKAFRFRSTKPPAHKATTLAAREECLRRKELGELVNTLLLHFYLLVVVLLSANSSLPDRGHWSVRGVDVAFTGRGESSIYNVTTRDSWYIWMENVFTKSAFWEPNYLDLRGFTRDGGFYRLGSIRLRMQLRDVCDNGNCVENGVPSSIQSHYSDKTGFSTAGTFTWYDESGHVIYLPATREDSLTLLESLKSHSWINKATSVVFVEMSLYTPSTNTFVDVKYITEFPDFCSAQSRMVVSPLHVLFRNSTQEILLFVVLGTYVVGLVLLLREIFHTYVEHGSTPSLTYNTVLAVFMIGSFVIHLTRILEVNHLRNRIIEKSEFLDLSTLNFLTTAMSLCYGMSTFLLIMRSILILKFFRLINVFHVVLFIALKNVLHFAIFLIITIVIFALTGMILFGSQVLVFSSFTKSVMALLAVLTRNMEYLQFKEVAPIVAPLYFIVFYGVTYVVLSRIVAAIFIRTMFEIRRGKADERQAELAQFLWNKFQEWLWEEEDEAKKRKKKTPNHDVVSTKVEEMEAFVNALLRTVESSISRGGSRRGSGAGVAPGSAGGSQRESHLTTRPNSGMSFTSNAVSRPTSVPKTAGSSSGKRKPILKSGQAFTTTRPKLIEKSVRIDDLSVLEDLNSPPLSPKKYPATPLDSNMESMALSSKMPSRNIEEATFSFITPMRPIAPKKNKARSPPKFVTDIDSLAHSLENKDIINKNERPGSLESPNLSSVQSDTMSQSGGLPLTSLSRERDFPDTVRMMTLPLSPPNVPTHIQPIINKRAELPPLLKSSRNAISKKKNKNLSKKRSAKTFSNSEKPIIGGNTDLTPVEQNQEPDHLTKNRKVERSAVEVGQESRIRKVICDIKKMTEAPVKEAEPSCSSNEPGNTLVPDPESSCQQSENAFNQLREHLQRGDTCPDLIIKSLLTEIDRPQTTPGEMQKQRAILAEHLLKAGWDAEPPFLQREHTEMSLFSLLTRESTQLSDWPSISRESTMEYKMQRAVVEGGEGCGGPCSGPSECEDPQSELPEDVSALIKRALAQVSGGVLQQDNLGSGSGKTSAGSNLSSTATDASPMGPPEPIVTENTFIFARDM